MQFSRIVEYKDEEWSVALVTTLSILVLLISLWIQVNIPSEAPKATFFAISAVFVALSAILEWKFENVLVFFNAAFFGTKKDAILGFGAGVISALIILVGIQNTGNFSFLLPTSILPSDTLSFLYVNLLSPTIEELLFRGIIFFSMIEILGLLLVKGLNLPFRDGWSLVILAMFATSIIFGLYHFYAYQGNIDSVWTAVIVSIIWIIGMIIFKSIAFPLGFHFVNNAIATGIGATSLIIFGITIIGITLLARFLIAPAMRTVGLNL